MPVVQLPALEDNYIHILTAKGSNYCIVIDPTESKPVLDYCRDHDLIPKWILCTHHHHDHVGGNLEIQKKYGSEVWASHHDKDRIPGITRTLQDKEAFNILDYSIKVLACPGHTLGALTYLVAPYDKESPLIFTGDTLFTMGCGRLFEGTPEQMWQSLEYLKRELPDKGLVYCGHEYTLKNTAFARQLSQTPNPELESLWQKVQSAQKQGQSTVPSLFALEKKLNPFLLSTTPAEFARIRSLRNEFRLEP